jgi:hypothetical protein
MCEVSAFMKFLDHPNVKKFCTATYIHILYIYIYIYSVSLVYIVSPFVPFLAINLACVNTHVAVLCV